VPIHKIGVIPGFDKCYENKNGLGVYREDANLLGGHDPYNNSKEAVRVSY
jgi:hypothetical protein